MGGDSIGSVRPGVSVDVMHEPVGVVGLITPWNFPMAIPAWKIAPALAYGNTVLYKPSELVPACAWALSEIIHTAGVPAGVFNLLMGGGDTGRLVVDAVDAVSFTGSVATGTAVAAQAVRRMIPAQCELGGKNPLVVLADADLTVAVDCAVQGGFMQTGQRCTASSRLIVDEAIVEPFTAALKDRLSRLTVDDGTSPTTDIGPVADARQFDKDLDYIRVGKDEGARLAFGGEALRRNQQGLLSLARAVRRHHQFHADQPGGNLRSSCGGHPRPWLRRGAGDRQRHYIRIVVQHCDDLAEIRPALQVEHPQRRRDGQSSDSGHRLSCAAERHALLGLWSARNGPPRDAVLHQGPHRLHICGLKDTRAAMKAPFTTRPEITGTFGVVTSTHWIASAVGMAMLERGGNAFDAAVATGFALQIVEPHLNGPGGEVPIILWKNGEPGPRVICGQGTAPAAATIAHYDALGLKLVPGTGLLAAVVPGAFDAWMLMLRDYGTMSLADVLAPTIAYARNGYPIVERAVQAIYTVEDFFRTEWPTSAAVWLPGNRRPKPGTLHKVPEIADTYERLCREAKTAGADRVAQIEAARAAFYEGFVAEAIDAFVDRSELMDTSGRRHKGLLTGADMAAWRATYEEPVGYDYGGVRLFKTGPWGQGPVLLQALALLKGFDLSVMDPLGDAYVHTVAECMKLAMADREAFYGDPAFTDIPLTTLLSDDYNDARRKLVGATASNELRPGDLPDAKRRLQAMLERAGSETPVGAGSGEPTFIDLPEVEGDTVHLDVIDRWGNVVSATPSGGWLQSSPVVPELGFPITTRGADVLARRGSAVLSGTGTPASHNAHTDDGRPRR